MPGFQKVSDTEYLSKSGVCNRAPRSTGVTVFCSSSQVDGKSVSSSRQSAVPRSFQCTHLDSIVKCVSVLCVCLEPHAKDNGSGAADEVFRPDTRAIQLRRLDVYRLAKTFALLTDDEHRSVIEHADDLNVSAEQAYQFIVSEFSAVPRTDFSWLACDRVESRLHFCNRSNNDHRDEESSRASSLPSLVTAR